MTTVNYFKYFRRAAFFISLLFIYAAAWAQGVQITSIVPSEARPGETVNIVINGQGFHSGTTFLFDDLDAYVTNLTVVSSSMVTATIAIPGTIPLGVRDILARNADSADMGQFTITDQTTRGPAQVQGTWLKEDAVALISGQVYVWGERDDGLQGNGIKKISNKKAPPAAVEGLYDIVSVTGNEETILALDKDGNVFAWGENDEGQLGCNISAKYLARPCFVMSNIETLIGAENFNVALDKDGDVWTWGDNGDGQLGTGKGKDRFYPAKVSLPGKVRVIGRGEDSAWVVTDDNRVFAWGENDMSSMSLPNKGLYYTPVHITSLDQFAADIVYIGGGEKWTAILLSDGRVFAWGRMSSIGINVSNTNLHTTVPTFVTDGVEKMFARENGVVAIKANGELWSWGYFKKEASIHSIVPTLRPTWGKVVEIGGGQDYFTYETEDGKYFGVGKNDDYLFNKSKEGGEVAFPGIEVQF